MTEPQPTVFVITGPPAAGKTSLCLALARRLARCVHIPVDDLRTWVVSGLADSVPWTHETERQFQIAEEAACDLAIRYQAAGFAVALDHCRNLERLDALISARLSQVPTVKACLLPSLAVAQQRNRSRTNKSFDHSVLVETIAFTHARYSEASSDGWLVLDNSAMTVEDSVDQLLALHQTSAARRD